MSAYCVGGLVLEVPAKTIPALVDWTLTEGRLGQARLHRNGRDADPILVLTASALERFGLAVALSGFVHEFGLWLNFRGSESECLLREHAVSA